jgi:hypothetical protein
MRALQGERPPDEEESPALPARGGRALIVSSTWQEERSENTKDTPAQQIGAFATAAEWWWKQGVAPIPLGGPKGNQPLVSGFTRWKRPPALATIRKWVEKWPDANIGIVTGPAWRVTVVDVDDPKILGAVLKRFGESPLWVDTPRGGTHLYYRSDGEGCADLRPELNADVKGRGGIIVVPPSVRPSGEFAGRAYKLLAGSWDTLQDLPTIKPGALVKPSAPASSRVTPLHAVAHGTRNKTLQRLLLRQVRHCDDLDALVDVGRTIVADQFEVCPADPFTDAEIIGTAKKVWEYEATGNNWAGREPSLIVPASVLELDPDAGWLFMVLRAGHWEHQKFAVSPVGMAVANLIPGWGRKRYLAARQTLLDRDYLVLLHQGGSKLGDPSLFTFGKAAGHTLHTSSQGATI